MINQIEKTINISHDQAINQHTKQAYINSAREKPSEAAIRLFSSQIDAGYKLVATNPYTDSKGNAVYWRPRFENQVTGKKFIRPMKYEDAIFSIGEPKFSGKKPLFRLDRITNHSGPIWIAEGEKVVLAFEKLGLLATTSGSATSASDSDWLVLQDLVITIWPDNDEPGKKYAQEVAEILTNMNCEVYLIDITNMGLCNGGDLADWLVLNPKATKEDVDSLPKLAFTRSIKEVPMMDMLWPEPQSLFSQQASTPYPIDALPAIIGDAVREVVSFVKCPFAIAACSALSVSSLAAQSLVNIERAEGLNGPVSMYFLAIAESGERKTSSDNKYTTEIRAWEKVQAEACKQAVAQWKTATEIWEIKHDVLLSEIKSLAKLADNTDALQEQLEQHEMIRPFEPKVPKLLYADITPEKLAYNLATEWPSAGILSSEAGVVFGGAGMGKESAMRNLALLNVMWDGGEHKVDRRSSDSFVVHDARLTMGLAVQADTVRTFIEGSNGLARGTGFLARFLVAWPETTQGTRMFEEAPKNWPHLANFQKRIKELLND